MHIGKKGDILTSVRVQDVLFEDFKKEAIGQKITMRNLLERSMYLYLTDPDFKKIIHNQVHAHYKRTIE